MKRQSLDIYDPIPEAMANYLSHNGWHFNKKMCEYAVSMMYKNGKRITPYNKQQIDILLKNNGIQLENNVLYDHVYVANMGKADFLGSSIADERHLLMYIKDAIDDEDGYDGIVFNRWYADMCKKGIPIDWEEML